MKEMKDKLDVEQLGVLKADQSAIPWMLAITGEEKKMNRNQTEEYNRIMERLDRLVSKHFEQSVNCAQSPFAALHQEFGLEGDINILIKAATFMPGLVSRKETCGAVIGCLMALGLVYGSDHMQAPKLGTKEMDKLFEFKRRAWTFCEKFKQEFGSTSCGDIRPKIMGPEYYNYDGLDPKWRQKFLSDGGATKCRVPPVTAAKIAAELILKGREL